MRGHAFFPRGAEKERKRNPMKIYTSENCGELIKRSGFEDERIASAVHTIVEDVKKNGDRALFACI